MTWANGIVVRKSSIRRLPSILRTTPLAEALNPLSEMEFYGGHKRPGEAESMHPRSKVNYLLTVNEKKFFFFFFNFCEQEYYLN